MPRVCILTDNSVQFPHRSFAGDHLVRIVSFRQPRNAALAGSSHSLKVTQLPTSLDSSGGRLITPPTVDEFHRLFKSLRTRFDEIVAIFLSSQLCGVVENANQAVTNMAAETSIHVIDSQSAAVGLGYLVLGAALAATRGLNGTEIKREIMGQIAHVFGIFLIKGLTYLQPVNIIDRPQAVVGELLDLSPLFVLENGSLIPVQKIRNSRHLIECLYEFVSEFDRVEHIAIVQGAPPFEQEVRTLRERLAQVFPHTPISEHHISVTLASILGPRSLGVFVTTGAKL